MKKRALSLFLALVLCLGLMPAAVFAEEGDTTGSETTSGDTTSGDTSGGDTSGSDTTGGDTSGSDTTGGDTSGSDTTGGDTTGNDTTGSDTSGETPADPEDTAPQTVTVTFDSMGGSPVPSMTVTVGQPYGTLPTPTREGYTFNGWYTNSGNEITSSTTVTAIADLFLNASWTATQITVSFDSTGGSSVSSQKTATGQTYGTLPTPTRSGYTFDGWFTEKDGGSQVTKSTTVTATSDHTLYAHWKQLTTPEKPRGDLIENARMYLWTTNYHERMDSTLNVGLYDSSNPSVSVHLKETVGLVDDRNPVIRWTVEDSSVARIYERSHGSPSQASRTVDSPINNISLTIGDPSVVICPRKIGSTRITAELYEIRPISGAYGSIGEAALSFTLNVTETAGDVPRITIAPQSVTLKVGEKKEITVTLSEGQLDNPWLIFPEAGKIEDLVDIPSSKNSSDNRVCTLTLEGTAPGTADLNLYLSRGRGAAIPSTKQTCRVTVTGGSQNAVTVSFDSNGGSSVSSKTVTVGETYGTLSTPTRSGYTFNGWYTSRTGGSEVTSSTKVTETSNHTLYAHWTQGKPVTVTVYFDSNGGSSVSDKTVTVGERYGSLSTPTREGYTFDGWYTSRTGGSEVTSYTTVTQTSSHTLYAHWTQVKPNQVTVSFDSNGGSSVYSRAVTPNETYGTLPTPTREGYTFDGWYTAATGGSKVTGSTRVTETSNHTLYAHWTKLETTTGEQPSAWAKADVERAAELGILAQELQDKYRQPITRAEFCSMADLLWSKMTEGSTAAQPVSFTDTDDVHVLNMAAEGIVSGVGDSRFNPDGQLTREQAAAILVRLADTINDRGGKEHVVPAGTAAFADNGSISGWALEAVGRVQAGGVMSGVGENMFSPKGNYTREQAVITVMRIYDLLEN